MKLRCFFGKHAWEGWFLSPFKGDREYRYCPICGKQEERKI